MEPQAKANRKLTDHEKDLSFTHQKHRDVAPRPVDAVRASISEAVEALSCLETLPALCLVEIRTHGPASEPI